MCGTLATSRGSPMCRLSAPSSPTGAFGLPVSPARAGSRSGSAESFRALRAHIDHLRTRDGRRIFVVTAAGRTQGTTTVAANLAIAIANTGDLGRGRRRRPPSPRPLVVVRLSAGRGLSEVLAGKAELDAVLRGVGDAPPDGPALGFRRCECRRAARHVADAIGARPSSPSATRWSFSIPPRSWRRATRLCSDP